MMDSTRDDGSARPAAAAREAPRAADEDPHAASMDQVAAARKEASMLRRKLEEVVHQRNALHELMRRSQDLHILFDMEGRICYAGSEAACSQLLGRVSQSLFDEPLHKILAPGAQHTFEAYINHILEAQSVRELTVEERRVRTVLVDAKGRQRHVEGHGQAWQRGTFIEFVFAFREIAALGVGPERGLPASSEAPPSSAAASSHPPHAGWTGMPVGPMAGGPVHPRGPDHTSSSSQMGP
ncbi:hypothetical protein FNF29_03918 [Cafeteria roenbergensis]|uniref:PAS domain-containing protein n=1 Tax=Cafeteria roenbergensis TaxID=33653 RepID=A0A5A8CH10_CAFRO|nr:hypothetical protein FNF29_03918 [Cafeteria roenbergensis]|eukprot:KAA0152352.1 hypothetical protein FNF29_03918 [Cafeteria roenbergensis]